MRIAALVVGDYKAVSASLNWARAVVLFGRNDVGKSNILEAIAWADGAGLGRADPRLDADEPLVNYIVELDIEDAEGADADLLAALLQTRHAPPLFPYLNPDEAPPDRDREAARWGAHVYLSQFPASTLAWDFGADDRDSKMFKLGCVGEIYHGGDPVNTVGSLDQVRQALRERAIRYASDALAATGDPQAQSLFGVLLDRCLGSRWLLCEAESYVNWLAPPRDECSRSDVEAARTLAAVFGDEPIPILDSFTRALAADGSTLVLFLSIPHTHRFRPWHVVSVSGAPERLDELAREVETFVREHLDFVFHASGSTADPWLDRDDSRAISRAVLELCQSLSDHATAVAPPFVTRDYDLGVQPLEFEQWFRYGNRRLRLAVVRRNSEENFDLCVAGSGLAVWAGFAIEEAMRQVGRELGERLAELIARGDEGQSDDNELAPRLTPERGVRGRLYVFDEPERHLHPKAQEQAARWLTGRLDNETSILLATHALPFLSLPASDVEYALVIRDTEGTTRAESITADVWGVLDARANEAGLGTRAQLLQLARSFLIVEGSHDEAVLRHFYGERLDHDRIVVLPMHGAMKVPALIDAQLLARLDVPLIILFDDIRAAALLEADEPSRREVALHQLWHLMRDWPPARKAPHVVEFVLPDIYCALPDECVRQVVTDRGGSFPGWDRVVQRFRANSGGKGFKPFFLAESGLPAATDTDDLLKEILDRCRREPSETLKTAFAEVRERAFANATDPPASAL